VNSHVTCGNDTIEVAALRSSTWDGGWPVLSGHGVFSAKADGGPFKPAPISLASEPVLPISPRVTTYDG
jgi:hypothetical protein